MELEDTDYSGLLIGLLNFHPTPCFVKETGKS